MNDNDPTTQTYDDRRDRRPRRSNNLLLVLLFGAATIALLFLFMMVGAIGSLFVDTGVVLEEALVEGDPDSDDKLLLLNIAGVIMDGDPGFLGGAMTSPWRVARTLEAAREDDAIQGLLLVVNSPGGGVTASDSILDEIRRYKNDTGVPVVAYFKDVAASGGYYVAMASDEIVAHPTTITGSIGVIMRMLNYSGLYEKVGLDEETIISDDTPFKDIGSPTRPMREEERARLTSIVQEMYDRFVDVVAAGRGNLDHAQAKAVANGAIYSAGQALDNGLVDALGYRHQALDKLRARAGVDEDVAVVTYQEPPSLLESLMMNARPGARLEQRIERDLLDRLLPSGSGMMYLWTGWKQD